MGEKKQKVGLGSVPEDGGESKEKLETEYSFKEREYRNIEKQINDITEITIAIDSVKEELSITH